MELKLGRKSEFVFVAAGQTRAMYEVTQLIGNTWGPAASGRTLTVVGPADGQPVTVVALSSEEDVAAAVGAARAAAPGWARTAPGARGAALHAAASAVEAAADDLASIMSAEMGKPVPDARDSIL